MFLHGHPTAELWRANTLAAPYFKNKDGRLRTFDFAVANPPFSAKAWSSGLDPDNDEFGRFVYGIPPEKNGDYAFLSTAAGICTGAAAQKCTTGSVVACPRSPWEGPARGATRPRRGWRRPARGRGLWAHGVKRGVIRTVAGVVTVSA